MPYERPSGSLAVPVTAHAQINHGQCAYDGGIVGIAVKTVTPPADTVRSSRNVIASGESYNLRPHGVHELPVTGLGTLTLGELIYITQSSNALGVSSGAGISVVGKIVALAGTQGTPTGLCRVDFDQKVA